MKRISIILMMLSAAVFASCNKALEKDVVEAGFAPAQPVPTVSNLVVTSVNELEKSAVLTATFDGITAGMDSLEIGFMSSTDKTFQTSTAVLIDPANGTYSATVSVKPGMKNYFVAMAATLGGSAYSEVVEYDVPSVPWYRIVSDKYVANLESYFGDVYAHVIGVNLDADNKTLTLNNLDAWAADQGVPTSFTGTVDLDTRVASFDCSAGFVDHGIAAYGFYLVAIDPVALSQGSLSVITEFEVTFSEDGSLMNMPLWATVTGDGQIADIYLPATYTAM